MPLSHYDGALKRLAPTFKVGPVLIDPSDVKLPPPAIEQSVWTWNYKPGTNIWEETMITPSDHSADIRTHKPTINEGWFKYIRIEDD